MNTFQQIALLLTAILFAMIVIRFRRSTMVLVAGLVVIGLYTIISLAIGKVAPNELGLGTPSSWLSTIGFAAVGLAVMLAYSPLADKLAAHWFEKPPTLNSFRAVQQSKINLILGIIVAWLLGGILEELIARGIVMQSVEALLKPWLTSPIATVLAIIIAAVGAGLLHSYQGPRAVVIITQLSILFGILFVVSGYNLWTVILCHGLYDTIAFVRFANKTSKYANLENQSN
jgi:membrane protease YdiL (CAAX protease family)